MTTYEDINDDIIRKANKALYRGKQSPFKRCLDSLSQKMFDDRELAKIDNAPVFKIKKI